MKAIDLLKDLTLNITKGRNIIETAKKYHYSLDVLQGEIKPRKTYYATFKDSDITCAAPDGLHGWQLDCYRCRGCLHCRAGLCVRPHGKGQKICPYVLQRGFAPRKTFERVNTKNKITVL